MQISAACKRGNALIVCTYEAVLVFEKQVKAQHSGVV